jgi:hypothetical protein
MIEPVRSGLRLASLLLLFSVGSANVQSRSSTDIALEFILGNCFQPIDDISRVKSVARLFKWDTLSADALNNMSKPVDTIDYEAWHRAALFHRRQPGHIPRATNRGLLGRGKPTSRCFSPQITDRIEGSQTR